MDAYRKREGKTMKDKEKMQVERAEVEQVAAVQAKLNDPKKWVLYGFALGLKADNPILGTTMLPPTTETKAAQAEAGRAAG